jgi:hypothetical protein
MPLRPNERTINEMAALRSSDTKIDVDLSLNLIF